MTNMTITEANMWRTNGKIKVQSIEPTIIEKLPLGLFQIKVTLSVDEGKAQSQIGERLHYIIKPHSLILSFKNRDLLSSITYSISQQDADNRLMYYLESNYAICTFKFKIDPVILDYIEKQRNDDITLNFIFRAEILPVVFNNTRPVQIDIYDYNRPDNDLRDRYIIMDIPLELSETKWIKFLEDIGYSEIWVIELDRPKLEGYNEVLEFIDKAKDGLLNNSSPDSIITDLRTAWDTLDPFIKKYEEEINKCINGKSTNEPEKQSKGERIEEIKKTTIELMDKIIELRKAIDKLTQIGPHKDKYTSTKEDAQLCFRLTVSMVSYYSYLIKIAKKERNGND